MSEQAKALDIDALAQEICRVDGSHSLGAGALAEALAPYIATLSAPAQVGEADKGPWRWLDEGDLEGRGAYEIQSADFSHDALIKVSGDFADSDDINRYMKWLCAKLNSTTPPTPSAADAELTEEQKTLQDLRLYGTSFMRDGKRIDPQDVWIATDPKAGAWPDDALPTPYHYADNGRGEPLYTANQVRAALTAAAPQDDRFPNGLADAIAYADEMEEAAASLFEQVLGYETDGGDTGTGMLQAVARELAAPPALTQPVGGVDDAEIPDCPFPSGHFWSASVIDGVRSCAWCPATQPAPSSGEKG